MRHWPPKTVHPTGRAIDTQLEQVGFNLALRIRAGFVPAVPDTANPPPFPAECAHRRQPQRRQSPSSDARSRWRPRHPHGLCRPSRRPMWCRWARGGSSWSRQDHRRFLPDGPADRELRRRPALSASGALAVMILPDGALLRPGAAGLSIAFKNRFRPAGPWRAHWCEMRQKADQAPPECRRGSGCKD